MNKGLWTHPAVISPNNFQHKSLSNWSFNIAVGCAWGCKFCYVPQVSTKRMASKLETMGVEDPDAQWGQYSFLRQWDREHFRKSLAKAESIPVSELNPDGNRAVILCSTTDPFQVFGDRVLQERLDRIMTEALEDIRDRSTINVRILTRSPYSRKFFPLMATLGNRLLFGMSLPTLNNRLARVFEPHAPSPAQRVETLVKAKEAGLNIYVAVAPTYPQRHREDHKKEMLQLFKGLAKLDPVTIYHEPINIRAENVERIRKHAESIGVRVDLWMFQDSKHWSDYAMDQFMEVQNVAEETGLHERLHLWPDKSLLRHHPEQKEWIERWHQRISEWPGYIGEWLLTGRGTK